MAKRKLGTRSLIFDDREVIQMLRAAIEGVGSQDAFARRHGIDRTHLNQILSGKKIREHSGHAGSPPSESARHAASRRPGLSKKR
jgi:hypothetical protein